MRRRVIVSVVLAVAAMSGTAHAAGAEPAARDAAQTEASQRVETRSADLLAVGLVRGNRMTIHLSRLLDNAPVRDAAVTVVLRGAAHPAVAETDGSYTLETPELAVPGSAAVEFQVEQAGAHQSLKGTLQIASAAGQPEDKNAARQLGWWVLNFAVCIGFLWLVSRRRKDSKP
jgi:cobalt-zinc-cadmium efflux system membrane fusion protein